MNATQKTILIVEDEPDIQSGLSDAISRDGYRTLTASNGVEAVELHQSESPDLILLDIMLPLMNGYDVCRKIRESDKRIPILMLTAKTEEIDHVLGLELGADDYIAKPFRIRELLARIHAALRRFEAVSESASKKKITASTFHFGPATIDVKRFVAITEQGEEKELTDREMKLLELFSAYPQEALSRDHLLNEVWGIDYTGTTRTLDQHIAKLRAKIDAPGQPSAIKTVHGIGYKYID